MSNSIVLDLASRYAAAFGIMAVNKQLNTAVLDHNNGNYSFEFYPKLDVDIEKMTFKHGKKTLTFAGMMTNVEGVFAPPLMIDFSREKQLIETNVNGSDNVIVERWGTKSWQMDMRGILVDMENKVYPQSQIEELIKFFEINDIIEVEGIQFDDKEIDNIYFKDLRISPVEGFQDTIQISLTASSIQSVAFNVFKP